VSAEAYQIEKSENGVVVRTTSFRTERRSVLHSGIFNRELASSLAAGAVMVIMGFFFALYFRITVVHFIAAVFVFAALFILFRIYAFREAVLETTFDWERKTITISLKRTMGSRLRSYPMDALAGIRIHHLSMEPENLDAVKLVEKVAVQHGIVIPGFGKVEDFYFVELDFREKKIVIYSARNRQGAKSFMAELRNSLAGVLPDMVWET
jgi:Ca2+/Na+ antiporter